MSKLLPLLIYPLGLAMVLLLVALVWKRGARALMVLALILLYLGSNRWVAYSLVHSLEYQYIPDSPPPDAEAIVVLGGGSRSGDPPRPIIEINEAGDRLLYGAYLYREGKADHVLLTGGSIEWLTPDEIETEAMDMGGLMEFLGVPEDALWLEMRSRNTYENALYSREMLDEAGVDRILLVTSAMHMPRSVALFEQQGLDVTPAPTDFLVSQAEWDYLWTTDIRAQLVNLMPNAEYMAYTSRALKEYMGILVYGLRGWL
ncbi:MAG: YdcF family protein [Chloroflexota bacterium]